ncbi:MAG: AbrB/MazE/SpoVT family DNA-binding domain-containing protein [Candidatus Aenigmarchaeota archaeon]|nr:AbrB/MazE/SpoVT family DNA-binding domain-containing protein [Candidatus Aenigmarchaeota archaeon]
MREEKVSSKGQVVIPKYIRDAVGMKPGSVVIITKIDDKVLIMKKPDNPAEALAKTGQDMAMKNIRRQIKGE